MLYTIGFTIILVAAAIYLFRVWSVWRRDRKNRAAVAHALDVDSLPEAGWAKILAKARNEMPPHEYEKFEKGVYSIVGRLNEVNTSGLATEKEQLAAFVDPNWKPPSK